MHCEQERNEPNSVHSERIKCYGLEHRCIHCVQCAVHCVNQEQVETWLKSTVRPKAQKGRGVQPHRDDFPLTFALTPVLPNSHVSSQRDVIGKREHACKLEIIIYSSNICVLQRSGENSVSNPCEKATAIQTSRFQTHGVYVRLL